MSTHTDPNGNGSPPGEHQDQPRISTEPDAQTPRQLMRAVIVFAVILLLGFVIAFWVHWHDESKAQAMARDIQDATPIVNVVPAQASEKIYPLELPGETAGWDQSPIFPRVDGYVATWSADIGDHVKQGQVLATIDTPEMDQQLIAARAKSSASAAQVHVAEISVMFAKMSYDRWHDAPKGVVTVQESEDKQAGYEEAIAKLAAAKAQNQLDEADVGRYTAMEKFKNLTAPYAGIITARHIDIGNLVSAGSSGNAYPLYNMARIDTVRVFVNVPQKAGAEVQPGLDADAVSDQYPGRIFHGKVTRTATSMDPQTRTQRTEVDIENRDLLLVPNMYVQVTFQLNQRGLPEVPAAAMLSRVGGEQLAVVNPENKIEFRRVTIARDNGDTVVIASGINVGEKIALNLSSAIVAGEEVKAELDTENSARPAPPQPAAPTMQTAGSDNSGPKPPAPTQEHGK